MKKILIITQSVDPTDTALGFFMRWIQKIAEKAESVEVICLKRGAGISAQSFLGHVHIHSLKKEEGNNRLQKIILFYWYIWSLRHQYDSVFVHMNQEYVLLGGLMWKCLGKKVVLWRNHPRGSFATRIAVALADTVLYTAPQSFTAQYAKAHIMPAGIDTELLIRERKEGAASKYSVLMFGRVSPIKRVDMVITACAQLVKRGIPVELTIVGASITPQDNDYMITVQHMVHALHAEQWIHFKHGVVFTEAGRVYREHSIFVNTTESGSFDKTVLEALAAGMKIVTTNTSMKENIPTGSYVQDTIESVACGIENMILLDEEQEKKYQNEGQIIVKRQSLDTLIGHIFEYI